MIRAGLSMGAVLALCAARPAYAGECSHGGGGGGGSSGGGSSGGGSSGGSSSDTSSYDSSTDYSYYDTETTSTTTVAVPVGCQEISDVHGHAQCRDFGDGWSTPAKLPPVFLELGTFARRLGPKLGGAGGHMGHEMLDYSYRVVDPGETGGDATAMAAGTTIRLMTALPHSLYLGVEGEIGGIIADAGYGIEMTPGASTPVEGPRPTVTAEQRLYLGAGAVAGLRHRFDRLQLGAEVAAGARTVQVAVRSQLGSCDITDYHYATDSFVEPRVRVDYWANPWVTVGMFAGGDLVHQSAMVGAGISVHLRAFDKGW